MKKSIKRLTIDHRLKIHAMATDKSFTITRIAKTLKASKSIISH